MTPMVWVVLGEGVFIVALMTLAAWLFGARDRALARVAWLESEQVRLAQAWAEKLAKAEMGTLRSMSIPDRHDLVNLINKIEAYRLGAPARRLEGE